MAHAYAKPLYDSPKWKACRQAYIANRIKIDGGLCEECHMRIGRIVHHKQMISEENINDPNITLNHDNLEYVCKYCHDRMEDHFVKTKSSSVRYKFDEFGQPFIVG